MRSESLIICTAHVDQLGAFLMFFIVVRKTEINQEWHLNGVDTVIENEIIAVSSKQ